MKTRKSWFQPALLFLLATVAVSCTSSPVKDNIEVYTYVWDEIVNKRNIDLLDTHFTSDYTLKTATVTVNGLDEAREYYGALLAAFSDIEFVVEDIFGQDDRLVKRWVFNGTHTADFDGIPATGNRVKLIGVTVARMIDGKIAEEFDYTDDLGFLQQLGVIPALGE